MNKETKKIKAWIEIYKGGGDCPTIMMQKPLKCEIENSREFGYKIYPAVITYNEKDKLK